MYRVEAFDLKAFKIVRKLSGLVTKTALASAVLLSSAWGQSASPIDVPLLITYGPEAGTREGDPTYSQVIYLELPEDLKERVYVRVFDPDSGGEHDLVYGQENTSTRFALYGGEGVLVLPDDAGQSVSEGELNTGVLLSEKRYGQSDQFDNSWVNVGLLKADQGEKQGGRRLFRLLVTGEAGNDGNLYDVAMSLRDQRQLDVPGARIFTYSPTVRVPNRQSLTELRFGLPEDAQTLSVHNFDAAHGKLQFTSAFRSIDLKPSGQDQWRVGTVDLLPEERGELVAITLKGGGEIPNDATFFVSSSDGDPLAVELPPYNWMPNRRPQISATTTFLDGCRAVSFDASATTEPDGDELSYLWRFSDGSTMTGNKVVKTYQTRGRYTERLEVRDNSGQIGNGSAKDIDVWVKAPPVPDIEAPGIVGAGDSVHFDASGSFAVGASVVSYRWLFNDGSIAQGKRVARVFEKPGDYQITLNVSDDSGHTCNTARLTTSLHVNAGPVAEAGSDRRIEADTELRFDGAGSYDVDGEIRSFVWDMGDGTQLQGPDVRHSYDGPGEYRVTLQVTDNAGVSNSVATDWLRVLVNAPPVPEMGSNRSVAVGEVIRFDGSESSDSDGEIISYLWEFGDGTSAFDEIVEFAYNKPGTYSARLTVTDDSGTNTSKVSKTVVVRVNGAPVASAGPDQTVTTSEVQFDGSGSSDPDDQIVRYEWDFGDGSQGEGPQPVHVYKRPGMYKVRLTVTDASETERNTSSDGIAVVVNTPPIADAGADLVGAPGEELVFQASRSIDPDGDIFKYEWDFKDGTKAEGEIVRHAFEKPGRYFVGLKVTDETGHTKAIDFDETEVFINEKPTANGGDDIRVAPGETFTLSADRSHDPDGEITDYRWDVTDNPEPIYTQSVELSFADPGTYVALLTILDESGADNSIAEDQVTIRVNHQPKAVAGSDVFTGNSLVAFDAGASLDSDGDGLTYSWDFGDGSSATGPLVAHTFANGGIYPVTLTVSDGTGLSNSEDQDSLRVTLNNAPVAVAGSDQRICTGDILVLDGSASSDPDGGVLKYGWTFGDGRTSDIINPTNSYRKGGVYPVVLTVTDDSGLSNNTAVDQIAVTVDQAPVADAGVDMKVCANTEASFDGSNSWDADGVVNRYLWDFGDGGSSGGDKPKHIFRRAGKYNVRLTIEGDTVGQCDFRASDDIVVEVTAAPVPRITAPAAIAAGEPLQFDGSGSYLDGGEILGWSWDFGDGNTAVGPVQTYIFEKPGVYRVGLTVDSSAQTSDCRQITDYHLLTVNAAPVADAGPDVMVGVNEEVLFDGSASNDPDGALASHIWSFDDGTQKDGVNVRHRFAEAGTYEVKLAVTDTASLSNSTATDTVTIKVVDSAFIALTAPDAVCVGEEFEMSANQSGSTGEISSVYKWGFGDGTSASTASVWKSYSTPGRYNVSVLADDGSSRTSSLKEASKSILVNTPPRAVAGENRLVCPGDPVRFSGRASSDPDGGALSYQWDFGDGAKGAGAMPQHVFEKPGTYEVTLKVKDTAGSTCSVSTDTLLVSVNSQPSVDAGPDRVAYVGGANDREIFTAWRSYDLDGTDLDHVWTFGEDGQHRGKQVAHTFQSPGDYNVTLTADDGSGLHCGRASDTMNVRVYAREDFKG